MRKYMNLIILGKTVKANKTLIFIFYAFKSLRYSHLP